MKTIGLSFLFNNSITLSVNISHPLSLWDAAKLASTVRTAFRRRIPWSAQGIRLLVLGKGIFKSSFNSLKIFCKDGGFLIPFLTENDNPSAWCSPWYGSWPNITTLTSL